MSYSINDQFEFLNRCGVANCSLNQLERDASSRIYMRIGTCERPMLFVIDRNGEQDKKSFFKIQSVLKDAGFSVPEIYEMDLDQGYFLVEDLGKTGLNEKTQSAENHQIFGEAVNVLVRLQTIEPKVELPDWGPKEMVEASVDEFFGFWWPSVFGRAVDRYSKQEFTKILNNHFDQLFERLNPVFVHRDYFANNLIWLPKRSKQQRIGIIDFQHASIGLPEYDIASIIDDVRNNIGDNLRSQLLEHYFENTVSPRKLNNLSTVELCSFVRLLRITGLWSRLIHLEGRSKYLRYVPRTWELLRLRLENEDLKDLKTWFYDHIPPTTPPHANTINYRPFSNK